MPGEPISLRATTAAAAAATWLAAAGAAAVIVPAWRPTAPPVPRPAAGGDAEAAERRAEIADLARRVAVGTVLTIPVLFGVMASDFFHPAWLPAILINAWFALAMITPVLLYTGWPIHRTGWLGLAHRSPDMNSLVTLGATAAFAYSLVITLAPSLAPVKVRGVYYEEVGFILTLILVGRLLETRAKAGTGEAIRALLGPAGPHRDRDPRRHRGRAAHRAGRARRRGAGARPGRRSRSTARSPRATRRWMSRC